MKEKAPLIGINARDPVLNVMDRLADFCAISHRVRF